MAKNQNESKAGAPAVLAKLAAASRAAAHCDETDDMVDVAVRVPRTAFTFVAPPPALVTQKNCEQHLGYGRRVFLERVRDYATDGGRVVVDGKIRGVEPGPFVRWLERRSAKTASSASPGKANPANDHDDLEELANELGLVRVGGRR